MKKIAAFISVCLLAAPVLAKLPAPNDEAKAKAAAAAAKTAHDGKVGAFQLCKSQNKAAAHARAQGKAGKAVETPACADPGPFVYKPAPAAPAADAKAKKS